MRYHGVELVTEVELSAGTDLYLADHLLDGNLLFPAVFGMEAMAQVAGAPSPGGTGVPVIEDVRVPAADRGAAGRQHRRSGSPRSSPTTTPSRWSSAARRPASRPTTSGPGCGSRGEAAPDGPPEQVADGLPAVPAGPGGRPVRRVLFQGGRFQRLRRYHRAGGPGRRRRRGGGPGGALVRRLPARHAAARRPGHAGRAHARQPGVRAGRHAAARRRSSGCIPPAATGRRRRPGCATARPNAAATATRTSTTSRCAPADGRGRRALGRAAAAGGAQARRPRAVGAGAARPVPGTRRSRRPARRAGRGGASSRDGPATAGEHARQRRGAHRAWPRRGCSAAPVDVRYRPDGRPEVDGDHGPSPPRTAPGVTVCVAAATACSAATSSRSSHRSAEAWQGLLGVHADLRRRSPAAGPARTGHAPRPGCGRRWSACSKAGCSTRGPLSLLPTPTGPAGSSSARATLRIADVRHDACADVAEPVVVRGADRGRMLTAWSSYYEYRAHGRLRGDQPRRQRLLRQLPALAGPVPGDVPQGAGAGGAGGAAATT